MIITIIIIININRVHTITITIHRVHTINIKTFLDAAEVMDFDGFVGEKVHIHLGRSKGVPNKSLCQKTRLGI